jgi:hypothetical protein
MFVTSYGCGRHGESRLLYAAKQFIIRAMRWPSFDRIACVCRKLDSAILMVKAAKDTVIDDH